jgi:hypothetical protein
MNSLTIWYGKETPIRARGKHQCKTLEFAEKYRGWHTFKQDQPTKRAVYALQSKGCLEVIGDQFRFAYP